MIKISATLPGERREPGQLFLEIDGERHGPIACLGKADQERADKAGNPARDPILPYGDTPTGVYRAAKLVHHVPPHARVGEWFLPLVGRSGEAFDAMAARTAVGIHAGRGNDRLVPTYGCLRVSDDDMAEMAAIINGREVDEIVILEV